MKFNLTITDMNEEEFAAVFKAVHTPTVDDNTTESVEEPVDELAVDKEGLHWDSRIHSSNKQMTSKGVWQRRRGISDEEFNRVKNELLGVQEPVAPVAPVAPEPTPVVAPVVVPTPLSPELVAVNHTLYTSAEELAQVEPNVYAQPVPTPVEPTPAPVAPEPQLDANMMFQVMFKKLQTGLGNNTLKGNDIRELLEKTNKQFALQCQNLTQFKDNIAAIQFIINDLTVRGL